MTWLLAPDALECCPDHPDALVRRTRETRHVVRDGYPAGEGVTISTYYDCAECGRALAVKQPGPEPAQ